MAGEHTDIDHPLPSPSLPLSLPLLPSSSSPSSSPPLPFIISKNGTHLFDSNTDYSPALSSIFFSLLGSDDVIDWRRSNNQRKEILLVCKMWNDIMRSQVLHLSVSPANAEYLLSSLHFFHNLRTLNAYGTFGDMGAELFASIKTPTIFKVLDLSVTGIGEQGAEYIATLLAKNNSITKLDLGGDNGAIAIFKAINGKSIEWLTVRDCGLDFDSLEYFGKMVADSKIRVLNWSYNPIGYFGAVSLAQGLKLSALSKLILQDCELAGFSALTICEVMKVTSSITSLNIDGNEFAEAGTTHLIQALQVNPHHNLSKLKMARNEITAIPSFGQFLATNRTLTYLDLSMNAFGAESHMIEFFAGLGRNSTLKTLILAGNNINDEFGPAIGKALQENKSLTYLDLSNNYLENQIGEIALALQSNVHLCKLNISKNLFREREILELILALEQNITLVSLNISRCKLDSVTSAIRGACKKVILRGVTPPKIRVYV